MSSRPNQRGRNQRQYTYTNPQSTSVIPSNYLINGMPNVPMSAYSIDVDQNGQFDANQQQQQSHFVCTPVHDERYSIHCVHPSEFVLEQPQQIQSNLSVDETIEQTNVTSDSNSDADSNNQIDFINQQIKTQQDFDTNRQYQYNKQMEYNMDNSNQFINTSILTYQPHYFSAIASGPVQASTATHTQSQSSLYNPSIHQHPAIGSPLYITQLYPASFFPHFAFNMASVSNPYYNQPQMMPHTQQQYHLHQKQSQQQQQTETHDTENQSYLDKVQPIFSDDQQTDNETYQKQPIQLVQPPQQQPQYFNQSYNPQYHQYQQHPHHHQHRSRRHNYHNKDSYHKSNEYHKKEFRSNVNNNDKSHEGDFNKVNKTITSPTVNNVEKMEKNIISTCDSQSQDDTVVNTSNQDEKKEVSIQPIHTVEQVTKTFAKRVSINATNTEGHLQSSNNVCEQISVESMPSSDVTINKVNDSNNNEIKGKTSWASIVAKNGNDSAIKSNINKKSADVKLEQNVKNVNQKSHTKRSTNNNVMKKSTGQQSQQRFQNQNGKMQQTSLQNPCNTKKTKFDGPIFHRIGEHLNTYKIDRKVVSFQPRGFVNRSNYCYVNSILQALCACSPFVNLLLSLSNYTLKMTSEKALIPIISGMTELIREFSIIPKEKGARSKDYRHQKKEDLNLGLIFEPTHIYKILNSTETLNVDGKQHDAEEFLGCLLNGLNDEMNELMKFVNEEKNKFMNENTNKTLVNGNSEINENENEWTEMGPRNKGSIIRRTDLEKTPISDIFRGQLKSRIHRYGDQVTDNVQPFFTLPLYIEKANSVMEAIELMTEKEPIEGITCSKTNREIEAWQQVSIEELPLVLILHLKCFHYKERSCTKIVKPVEFPVDLRIDIKYMSSKFRLAKFKPLYKLFAVVYHDGKEAVKGHYMTDAYHSHYATWIRFDDTNVTSVTESEVLSPSGIRVPYLLYYRRCD